MLQALRRGAWREQSFQMPPKQDHTTTLLEALSLASRCLHGIGPHRVAGKVQDLRKAASLLGHFM
jgi:hypothetical protein